MTTLATHKKPSDKKPVAFTACAECAVQTHLTQVQFLWKTHRDTCGWFIRKDFVPATREEGIYCLELLRTHGTLAVYRAARELEQCL